MKAFFNIKRIAYLSIICISLIILIVLLIVPLGSWKTNVTTFDFEHGIYGTDSNVPIKNNLANPFATIFGNILLWQTIVFTLIAIVFVVFATLFAIELKCAGIFSRRPTKAERMQAQIDELQKQVDELKKGE